MFSTYRQHSAIAHWARRVLGAAAIVCLSIPAYASDPPYNPNHVDNAQAVRLGEICESVMGLRPSETLTDNLWPGNPDEGSRTNAYRGCIAILSSSLQANATERAGSPELAVCILSVAEAPPASNSISLAATGHADSAFATCVEGLTRVMSARSMNELYRN